jgi:hypothetical protein
LRGVAVKVYLLPIGNERPVFYSEGPPRADGEAARPRRSLRRRLEERFLKSKQSLERSEGDVGSWLVQLWQWLHRHIGADEPLLRGLRGAGVIEVHHPASMPGPEARVAWEGYLTARWYHHLLWLTVNALLSPPSIVLMPVPGPNLIGYWFVYRAVCHTLALLGLRRAWGGRVETVYRPTEALDISLAEADDEDLARVAACCGLRRLAKFVTRVRSGRTRARPAAGEAVSPPGRCDCSATTSTRALEGATGSIGSSGSSG